MTAPDKYPSHNCPVSWNIQLAIHNNAQSLPMNLVTFHRLFFFVCLPDVTCHTRSQSFQKRREDMILKKVITCIGIPSSSRTVPGVTEFNIPTPHNQYVSESPLLSQRKYAISWFYFPKTAGIQKNSTPEIWYHPMRAC